MLNYSFQLAKPEISCNHYYLNLLLTEHQISKTDWLIKELTNAKQQVLKSTFAIGKKL